MELESIQKAYADTLKKLEKLLRRKMRQKAQCSREIETILEEIEDVRYAIRLMQGKET